MGELEFFPCRCPSCGKLLLEKSSEGIVKKKCGRCKQMIFFTGQGKAERPERASQK